MSDHRTGLECETYWSGFAAGKEAGRNRVEVLSRALHGARALLELRADSLRRAEAERDEAIQAVLELCAGMDREEAKLRIGIALGKMVQSEADLSSGDLLKLRRAIAEAIVRAKSRWGEDHVDSEVLHLILYPELAQPCAVCGTPILADSIGYLCMECTPNMELDRR